jgi:hypothetical protein
MAKGEKKSTPRAKSAQKKAAATAPRVRKLTRKEQRAKLKSQVKSRSAVIGSFRLTWQTLRFLREYWKPLGGIILIYLVLNIIFASGLTIIPSATSDFRSTLASSHANRFSEAFSSLGTLFGGSSSYNATANSVLQTFLIIIESLVLIWAIRHLLSGTSVKIKQAYYQSATPLIPFILVIFVILFQLLPLTIGSLALGILLASAFGNSFVSFLFVLFFLALAAWSLYLVSSSIFALYIVTLPNMTPLEALRSAKKLVKFRRLIIIRRLLFLPIVILALIGVIMIPVILFASITAPTIFYTLTTVALLFAHTYLYGLYRSLLG